MAVVPRSEQFDEWSVAPVFRLFLCSLFGCHLVAFRSRSHGADLMPGFVSGASAVVLAHWCITVQLWFIVSLALPRFILKHACYTMVSPQDRRSHNLGRSKTNMFVLRETVLTSVVPFKLWLPDDKHKLNKWAYSSRWTELFVSFTSFLMWSSIISENSICSPFWWWWLENTEISHRGNWLTVKDIHERNSTPRGTTSTTHPSPKMLQAGIGWFLLAVLLELGLQVRKFCGPWSRMTNDSTKTQRFVLFEFAWQIETALQKFISFGVMPVYEVCLYKRGECVMQAYLLKQHWSRTKKTLATGII